MFGGSPVLAHAIQLMPSPPGSGLQPAEPVDTAESDQTEEVVTAHGDPAEIPEEDEAEEEGRAVQEEQEPVIELHPQEDEIPEQGETGMQVCCGCVCVCVRGVMCVGGECAYTVHALICMYVGVYV